MGAICGVKECFCSGSYITLAVQQQVTNFLTELCATRLQGSNNRPAATFEPLLEQV
jgi:hypothetical protein